MGLCDSDPCGSPNANLLYEDVEDRKDNVEDEKGKKDLYSAFERDTAKTLCNRRLHQVSEDDYTSIRGKNDPKSRLSNPKLTATRRSPLSAVSSRFLQPNLGSFFRKYIFPDL